MSHPSHCVLSRDDYEFIHFRVVPRLDSDGALAGGWCVKSTRTTYPLTTAQAVVELRRRGFTVDVETLNGFTCGASWQPADIDAVADALLADDSLNDLAIALREFDIPALDYWLALRSAAARNVATLGPAAGDASYYDLTVKRGPAGSTVILTPSDDTLAMIV
ncbi:MAG TPA: hypothetical protein VMY42_27965 [Thermoguttaceae bacterium]|nr:hypothetical protein [Thermoguttaceae bacterium]